MKIQNSTRNEQEFKTFTSKSNVLKFLEKKLMYSKIEKIYDFTISDWQKNETEILNTISRIFKTQKVIVRSSAKGEDSFERSEAGIYESVLNVDPMSKNKIKKAIDMVINSYVKKGNIDPENQILIQKQTQNIITSGVVFTRTPDIGAPYFVINFEEGGSTVGVTKGTINNIIKIFRKINTSSLPQKWRSLLKSIKEIEYLLGTDRLDIEFGITQTNRVVIFQVRPITSIQNILPNIDDTIRLSISSNKNKFSKFLLSRTMNHNIFSDMSDWNPAEIIGNNPNLLDYSLYDYLIMKRAWQAGRTLLGYQRTRVPTLMVKFGNKPYVDIHASFNSLIPDKIRKKLKQKLIRYYIQKLKRNPQLHDKVEFEILFTCYDLTLDSRLQELTEHGFTKREINEIKFTLLEFTNEIIMNFPQLSSNCNRMIDKMSKNRLRTLSTLNSTKKDYVDLLNAAQNLLKDCQKFGTVNFSMIARVAFIGSVILKSLLKRGYVNSQFYNEFMTSVKTPVSEILDDFTACLKNHISKEEFLKKYGHLRPGTYDITSLRYDQENPFFDNIKFLKSPHPHFKIKENQLISKVLSKHNLKFHQIDFFTFIKNALRYREKLKFEFTHNLSDAIELIALSGSKLGFSRLEMANLDIPFILNSYKKYDEIKLQSLWRKKIATQLQKKLVNNYLVLPSIVFTLDDFEIIQYSISEPNYVTNKSITGDIVYINSSNKNIDMENKIILIENADPGYDWIFTKNPAALITKYGGVASHMAIRCAELGLPAAIGCGEILFEKLTVSSKVLLDCENKHVIILEHAIHDEQIEVKKILKSLGYIK